MSCTNTDRSDVEQEGKRNLAFLEDSGQPHDMFQKQAANRVVNFSSQVNSKSFLCYIYEQLSSQALKISPPHLDA